MSKDPSREIALEEAEALCTYMRGRMEQGISKVDLFDAEISHLCSAIAGCRADPAPLVKRILTGVAAAIELYNAEREKQDSQSH